jgi:hypothetical protein
MKGTREREEGWRERDNKQTNVSNILLLLLTSTDVVQGRKRRVVMRRNVSNESDEVRDKKREKK